MRDELSRMAGIRVFRSQANFLLLKTTRPGLNALQLCERLLKQKVLIRNVAGYRGLDGRFARISVRCGRRQRPPAGGVRRGARRVKMEMSRKADRAKLEMPNGSESVSRFSLRRHFADRASITRTESFAPGATLP